MKMNHARMLQWATENNLRGEGDMRLANEDLAMLAVRNDWNNFGIPSKYERLQQ
jgi:hypothetical protein